jgi:hypothetical protein
MTKEEKITMLIKAQQLFDYDAWFAVAGLAYTATNNPRNPINDYNEYVEETLQNFPW